MKRRESIGIWVVFAQFVTIRMTVKRLLLINSSATDWTEPVKTNASGAFQSQLLQVNAWSERVGKKSQLLPVFISVMQVS